MQCNSITKIDCMHLSYYLSSTMINYFINKLLVYDYHYFFDYTCSYTGGKNGYVSEFTFNNAGIHYYNYDCSDKYSKCFSILMIYTCMIPGKCLVIILM